MLAWAHPVLGGVATALAAYAAALGLRSRRPGRRAVALRARHRVTAPAAYAGMLVGWLGGLGSTVWLRDDLEATRSGHFALGSAVMALFTAAALVARRIDHEPWARLLHPWIGAAAVLLAGVQVFLGLQIMPR